MTLVRKIGYGFLLGKLGFRGLFVVIGALFSLAFLAVALPPLLVRWEAMQAVESRLAALGTKVGPAAMPKGPLPAAAKMRGVQRTVRRK